MRSSHDSFGRLKRRARKAFDAAGAPGRIDHAGIGGVLPFGNGRSYGDSCHNDAGMLADFRGSNRIVAFDPDGGIMEAEAGVMLHEIIDHAAPYGWFLPVTPGTRFVTLGGAVANDVHGKNHHRRGTFGCHVTAVELRRSGAGPVWLDRDDETGMFSATIGGMGLTGLILRVRLKLMKIGSLDVVETVTPFARLSEYFDQAEQADAANEYAVAWLDQLAGGGETRGVLLTANHAENGNFDSGSHRPGLSVPFDLPFNALNPLSLRLFNGAFYRAKAQKAGRQRVSGYQGYFYPLDAVRNWNRLYGPRGLFQHQSALPFETARNAIPELLRASRAAGEASFLTVLKRFGDVHSGGVMSFPIPGYTLTLDFPNRGERTLELLETLDRITIDAGGRVNPYKDARMSPRTFVLSFPQWRELEAKRDPHICSDFWRRTTLSLSENGVVDNFSDRLEPILTAMT
ncbi:FAD-binding oxidoreductase [Oricola cellulosilytica]|uniref:FAD-binding oxidoreductase n=1 Tax=Oricola cellulosilytica TaxID=1429082 RepID=A0A4R0PF93_9HYPH|nr:FAD-binding oxidoreductase [Oricola cellulosilytica]TCD15065.1 FAD-binding oxidoreductase [Oricola cellulosilytica]